MSEDEVLRENPLTPWGRLNISGCGDSEHDFAFVYAESLTDSRLGFLYCRKCGELRPVEVEADRETLKTG